MCNVPCPTCPWRKSAPVGGSAIPGFSLELMRRLENTVGRDDNFRPVMACHYSKSDAETTCIGYAAVHGWSNLNLRMMAMRGEIDLRAIESACDSLDLWGSFAEMLETYEEAAEQEE